MSGVPEAVARRWSAPGTGITALVVATTVVDLATKGWAHAHVLPRRAPDPGGLPVQLGLVMNRGVSLGVGADHARWVVAISAGALLALLVWLTRATAPLERTGIALALGADWATWPTDSPEGP